jgi:hypothetical protein
MMKRRAEKRYHENRVDLDPVDDVECVENVECVDNVAIAGKMRLSLTLVAN